MLKKFLIGTFAALMLSVVPPMNAAADEGTFCSVKIDGSNVILISDEAAKDGCSTLLLTLKIDNYVDADTKFYFEPNKDVNFKILECRYDSKARQLNVYISEAESLFKDGNSLNIGTLKAEDNSGKKVDVKVSADEDALKYVIPVDEPNADETKNPTDTGVNSPSSEKKSNNAIKTTVTTTTTTTKPTTTTTTTTTSTKAATTESTTATEQTTVTTTTGQTTATTSTIAEQTTAATTAEQKTAATTAEQTTAATTAEQTTATTTAEQKTAATTAEQTTTTTAEEQTTTTTAEEQTTTTTAEEQTTTTTTEEQTTTTTTAKQTTTTTAEEQTTTTTTAKQTTTTTAEEQTTTTTTTESIARMYSDDTVIEEEVSASLKIDETGKMTLISENAEKDGITTLRLSLDIETAADAEISFEFDPQNSKVSDYRIKSNRLNIYISGTELLFNDSDSLNIGVIKVKDMSGNDLDYNVSTTENSLKYVYDNKSVNVKLNVEAANITNPTTTTTTTTTSTTAKPATTTTTTTSATTQPTTTTTTTSETTMPTTTTTTTTSETTTESTTTATSVTTTEPAITTSTTVTTSVKHIASDEELCEWSMKDYSEKEGVMPDSAEITETPDGNYQITLTDESDNVLDVYEINPETGIGKDSADHEVNLPQTGNNSSKNILTAAGALMMTIFGFCAVKLSGINRRKKNEK